MWISPHLEPKLGSKLVQGGMNIQLPFACVHPDCITKNLLIKEQGRSFPGRPEVVDLCIWWWIVELYCVDSVENLNRCSCLLFTRGDGVTFFSPSSSPPLWELTNHAEEWISVPLWPPSIRSQPNRSQRALRSLS